MLLVLLWDDDDDDDSLNEAPNIVRLMVSGEPFVEITPVVWVVLGIEGTIKSEFVDLILSNLFCCCAGLDSWFVIKSTALVVLLLSILFDFVSMFILLFWLLNDEEVDELDEFDEFDDADDDDEHEFETISNGVVSCWTFVVDLFLISNWEREREKNNNYMLQILFLKKKINY